jgi:fibronectin type 3 domain-containing protein
VTITLSGTGTSGSYHVNLAWSAPTNSTDPVAGYNIYRAVAGSSSYQLMNASASAQTAFTDSSVQNGSNYTYYVESIDASGGASTPSGTVSVSVP